MRGGPRKRTEPAKRREVELSAPVASSTDTGAADQKLAERIANAIEREIIEKGWTVGESLGNEEALVKRFGVSRWVVREALAITERDGLTRMKRGRGGGLEVAAPAEGVVATIMRNYLLFAGAGVDEIVSVRATIDHQALRLAAERCTPAQRARLVELLARPIPDTRIEGLRYSLSLYGALMDATGNPVLAIFGSALSELIVARGVDLNVPEMLDSRMTGFFRELVGVRRQQAEAVVRADAGAAIDAERGLAQRWLQLFDTGEPETGRTKLTGSAARRKSERVAELYSAPRTIKRADTLSLQLQAAILGSAAAPGDPIASEAELMQRYDVGRGVLREAIRNLERHGFVQIEEGRNGGLHVGTPRPDATVRSAVLYIKFLRIAPRHLLEVGADLEIAAGSAAAARSARDGAAVLAPLAEAVAAFEAPGDPDVPALMRRYFVGLGEASGNRVLALFMRVLSQPLVVPQAESSVNRDRIQEFHSKLTAMLRALERGDALLARQYMMDTRQIGLLIGPRERNVEDLFGSL